MPASPAVLGRESELRAIDEFLERPAPPRALILRGEPGIGKTTLWKAALGRARDCGYQVRSTRPVESEAKISYLGLGDLLEPLEDDILDRLPAPQRMALDVALLRADPPNFRLDYRTVCVSVLAALRAIASSESLLIAIDDVEWLDGATTRVLEFTLRRLHAEPVRLIATVRNAGVDLGSAPVLRTLDGDDVRTVDVPGLSLQALHAFLRERAGATLAKPTVARLMEASTGNPFFALELVRSMRAGRLRIEPGQKVRLPSDLVPSHIAELASRTRELLLVCAAASMPTIDLLRSTVSDPDGLTRDLEDAVAAGVIELDDQRVRFTHPLLSSAVYGDASEDRRRRIHRRLAEVAGDIEERARHAALAAEGPRPDVATDLERAAEHARRRGAPGTAAELSAIAVRLTPPEDAPGLRARHLRAADYLLLAGDAHGALDMAAYALASAPPGPERAEALSRRGSALFLLDDHKGAADEFADALAQPGVSRHRLSAIHSWRAWLSFWTNVSDAEHEADEAFRLADATDDPAAVAMALGVLLMVRTASGSVVPTELERRARRLDNEVEPYMVTDRPGVFLALRQMYTGELDVARNELLRFLHEARVNGDDWSTEDISRMLGRLEHAAGDWTVALEHDTRANTWLGTSTGTSIASPHTALVLAHMGQSVEAEAIAQKVLDSVLQPGDLLWQMEAHAVLGFIRLSKGDAAGALEHLESAWQSHQRWGIGEPAMFPFVADYVEALIEVGATEDAAAVIAWLDRRGRELERPWALAVAARYRAMIEASRGDVARAMESLDEAMKHHDRLPMPFEVARTLLVLGSIRRRAKQKRPAREALERALEIFERLGAQPWAERARTELARISGRRPATAELTTAERRVARLAAAGRTNREIAATLFMSPRTVGGHLSHVYAKLGIRSRTDLALFVDRTDDTPGHS